VSLSVSSINLAGAWSPHTPIECLGSIELSQGLTLIRCVDNRNPEPKEHAQAAEPTTASQYRHHPTGVPPIPDRSSRSRDRAGSISTRHWMGQKSKAIMLVGSVAARPRWTEHGKAVSIGHHQSSPTKGGA
jgi:hypothetical protein